jgi:hypothetical protein
VRVSALGSELTQGRGSVLPVLGISLLLRCLLCVVREVVLLVVLPLPGAGSAREDAFLGEIACRIRLDSVPTRLP